MSYPLTRNYYENSPLRIIFRNFEAILYPQNLRERRTFSDAGNHSDPSVTCVSRALNSHAAKRKHALARLTTKVHKVER